MFEAHCVLRRQCYLPAGQLLNGDPHQIYPNGPFIALTPRATSSTKDALGRHEGEEITRDLNVAGRDI